MAPCEIITEFFYQCGHVVTSRRCRNMNRIWAHGRFNHPVAACDQSCTTTENPPMIHHNLSCTWCRQHPQVPHTNAVRSDPGQHILPADVIERRRREFMHRSLLGVEESIQQESVQQETERALNATFRAFEREQMWDTVRRIERMRQSLFDIDPAECYYFVGPDDDPNLMRPISDIAGLPADEICPICRDNIRDPAPVMLPCDHKFHPDCLRPWLLEQRNCPYCRAEYRIGKFEDFFFSSRHR